MIEPRWRKRVYGDILTYRGGTETFDIWLSNDGALCIVWDREPFCWATFDRVEFDALKKGKSIGEGFRIKQSQLRALRNYVNLFIPEFGKEESHAETTL